jgi:hypothetical protein
MLAGYAELLFQAGRERRTAAHHAVGIKNEGFHREKGFRMESAVVDESGMSAMPARNAFICARLARRFFAPRNAACNAACPSRDRGPFRV